MDSEKLQTYFRETLVGQLAQTEDLEPVIETLSSYVRDSDNPTGLLALFEREPAALSTLAQLFSASPKLTGRLVADPQTFDLLAVSNQPLAQRSELINELRNRLAPINQPTHAALLIRKFFSRHVMRIAYGEFVRGDSPDVVGRQLSHVADAILEAGLQFTLKRLADQRGMPERSDGSTPKVTMIGLGNLGGQEMSYAAPMKVVFLYDAIDHKNIWHRKFYSALVDGVVDLLCGDAKHNLGVDIDLREGPRHEVGVQICGFREAARIYETSGRTFQRLGFIKSRVVAGSAELGRSFLDRLEPWIYRQFITRVERAEIQSLRHKLERRSENVDSDAKYQDDVVRAAGGRADLELTVQFLQMIHGGQDRSVRLHNTLAAINGLHRSGQLSDEDRTQLAENYAKLCRLQHQISVTFDGRPTTVPRDPIARKRLAWQLGIRVDNDQNVHGQDENGQRGDSNNQSGDSERFERMLADTFAKNRVLMNHLIIGATGDEIETAAEADLLLDPDPDPKFVEQTLQQYKLKHPRSAMTDLASLSTETVPFLSPLRCRHVFSSIAPKLLEEVSRTPDPDAALHSLVKVTESLGAKATLWELLGANHPTMQLVVRLCATTPYLSGILTANPGMIDELVDSLVMNRLPSADRLDAHSIELCKGMADIDDILASFKSSAHLMIGVRDMLGKETLEATHQAIGDTAEACLRRVIDHEQEVVADQFGDPVDDRGEPAEMVALALGKLGGREPNYHSDLDAIFLFSAAGETRRRIGGRKATTSNHRFFNQVARQVHARINNPHSDGQLYELDSRLRPIDQNGPLAVTIDEFLAQFDTDAAPLWMRLALCKARAISGSRLLRKQTNAAVAQTIANTKWHSSMAIQIRELRSQMQHTARPENLKRGEGGTVDVEYVAEMLTLRHAREAPQIIRQGTTASLTALCEAGFISAADSEALIKGYRTLRGIEASLRLMNSPARHALPGAEELMNNLAFLMGETGPQTIRENCEAARRRNREVFNSIFDQASV